MKNNPGRKERRNKARMTLTKGYGHHSQYEGTHRKNREKHKNSGN